MSAPEQPYGPGAICEDCGHWAHRHGPAGCDTADLIDAGIRTEPCSCRGFLWLGQRWADPSKPAPIGLA